MLLHKGNVDCNTCEDRLPDLLPENELAWELWLHCLNCWNCAAFSVIGLNWDNVFAKAKILEIEITPDLLVKIEALESVALTHFKEHAKEVGKVGG